MNFQKTCLALSLISCSFFSYGIAQAQSTGGTTGVAVSGNLDATALITVVPSAPATFAELATAASFSATVNVYDSLNATHTVTIYFFHTAALAWQASVYVDGSDTTGGTAGAPLLITGVTLAFDSDGERTSVGNPDATATPAWSNGSAVGQIEFFFTPILQLASTSSITAQANWDTSCTGLQNCVDNAISTSLNTCGTLSLACTRTPDEYAITATSLATRAITKENCTRSFSSRRRCNRCFEKAKDSLRLGGDRDLFLGMLSRAQAIVSIRQSILCR